MGIFKRSPKHAYGAVVQSPLEKISGEMLDGGTILALYSRDGAFIADHMGKQAGEVKPRIFAEGFYFAMNLNFVQSFGNSLQLGLYDPAGTSLVSPRISALKLLHQFGDEVLVYTNSKTAGPKVSLADYDGGILISMLKLPKDWSLPPEGQIKVKLQSTMIFNPLELETFLLRVQI